MGINITGENSNGAIFWIEVLVGGRKIHVSLRCLQRELKLSIPF